jgi:branched-chain amino acid transport system permease protein
LVVHSNVTLNFLVVALMIALAGQGWNILGGYGGQYSFGHAAFFGTGAYVTAILQMRYGINAWFGFAMGIAGRRRTGRSTWRSRFSLRPAWLLLRAGDPRVCRSAAHYRERRSDHRSRCRDVDQTRFGHPTLQFQSRAAFYWIILALVGISLVIARLIERSRFRRLADRRARE